MKKQQKEVLQAQLNKEEELIKELKHIFGQAQDDIVNKIIDLARRKDMENLQTIIYQKQYQEILKKQIDNILDDLHTNEYSKIEEFLTSSYTNGFVGAMYDIAVQGVPLIIPIDPKQVVQAIQIDSKLSKSLYNRLGEDITDLKKAVRTEIARGIANGSSWLQVGEQLAKKMKYTPYQKAISNSIRIARTESHRIQVQSAMDAQRKAKAAGADIVKQWDAALDGRTRHSHRLLDGQIRELDEPFEVQGTKVDAPGMFGDPAEDCNCRCALLQRARWALDDDELQALREKAAFHGLLVDDSKEYGHEKAKDFSDFQNKYLNASKNKEGADSGGVRLGLQKIKGNEASYRDISEKRLKEATPNSHEVRELNEYTVDGVIYTVDGINVKQNNSPRELEVANILKGTFGGEIFLVPEVNGKYQGVKTPDYLFRGQRYDLKEISSSKEDALRNAIHKKREQADNFIIDVTKSDMTQEQIDKQIEKVFTSYNTEFVNSLIIIDGDKIMKIVERN